MKSRLVLIALLWVLPISARAENILFVGNSYTYFNNVPQLVEALAKANQRAGVTTHAEAAGGLTLTDHVFRAETKAALKKPGWTHLVLQEQSTLGRHAMTAVDGKSRVSAPDQFWLAATALAGPVKPAGAKAVFFMTWARRDYPEQSAPLATAYHCAGHKLAAQVAPVGSAFDAFADRARLYQADGAHPTALGSYLAAIVLYHTLFGAIPENVPLVVTGNPVNMDGSQPGMRDAEINASADIVTLVSISAQDRAVLLRAAVAAETAAAAFDVKHCPKEMQ